MKLDVRCSKYNEKKSSLFELVPDGGNWRNIPWEIVEDYMPKGACETGGRCGVLKRIGWDVPSMTILTSPQQKLTERCHPSKIRPLNITEYLLLQGFPVDFKCTGSKTANYRIIANAVPPQMAERIGECLY